eukprot:5611415-Pyramimonas_sp.AAC.1
MTGSPTGRATNRPPPRCARPPLHPRYTPSRPPLHPLSTATNRPPPRCARPPLHPRYTPSSPLMYCTTHPEDASAILHF